MSPRKQRGISPRALWSAVALVAAAGLIIGVVWLVRTLELPLPDNGVTFQPPAGKASLAAVLPVHLKGPQGIDGSRSRLFAAESEAGAIRTLGPKGQAVSTETISPVGAVKVAYPTDVAVFGVNLIVVDQAGKGAVLSIPQRGSGQRRIGGPGTPAALVKPTAVAADTTEVFVADAGSHTIKVYDSSLTFKREMGGALAQGLAFVSGMVVDGDRIWVADSNAGRVVAIDRNTGAMKATAKGKMQLPRGLARDTFGRLYVADEFGRVVRIFDHSGKSLGVIGDDKTGGFRQGGQMVAPRDVAWFQGRLYVTDRGAGVIRVYNVANP